MLSLSRSNVRASITPTPLATLVKKFSDKRIIIPPHQRSFCWNSACQEKLIQSILCGFPIPSLLMSESDDGIVSIEDGRQRLTTISHFSDNKFGIRWGSSEDITYNDLTSLDQEYFNNYNLMVQTYSGATDTERLRIFDNQQNGVSLKVGEKLHAQITSPLMSLVMELLMTPHVGQHDRAIPIWGVRGDPLDMVEGNSKDKRRDWLANATALTTGLVNGPKHATKKWTSYLELLTQVITDEKKEGVNKDLCRILEIYEAANARVAATSKNGSDKAHFDLGNSYTGCIMFSLSAKARKAHADLPDDDKSEFENLDTPIYAPNSLENDEEEWISIKNTWVDYIVCVRTTINETPTRKLKSVLEEKIHRDVSAARSWTIERWETGYNRVFGLDVADEDSGSDDDECGSEYSEE